MSLLLVFAFFAFNRQYHITEIKASKERREGKPLRHWNGTQTCASPVCRILPDLLEEATTLSEEERARDEVQRYRERVDRGELSCGVFRRSDRSFRGLDSLEHALGYFFPPS